MIAAAIVAVLAGGGVALRATAQREPRTITVTAHFEKAIGLFPLSDVRVLGVAVGEVTSVTPAGERVKVVMEIDRARRIPADARATVIPISLISDRYVQLDPPYEGGPALQDGAVLGLDRTSIPVELDDVLASLKKFLDALEAGNLEDPGALGDAVAALAGALDGTGEDLGRTLGGLGKVSEVVAANSARLNGIVVHLSRLLTALAERQTQITRLNTNLARALGAIAAEEAALDGTLANLAVLTEQLGSVVRDHRGDLEADLAVLAKTTEAVLRHRDSLVRANDWLHVQADGAEEAHNGGAVHKYTDEISGLGPVTHVDVRDVHYGLCPPTSEALCDTLDQLAGPSASAGRAAVPPGPGAATADPAPDAPLPSLLPLDLPPLPAVSLGAAGAVGPPAGAAPPPGIPERIARWFIALGGLIDRLIGGTR